VRSAAQQAKPEKRSRSSATAAWNNRDARPRSHRITAHVCQDIVTRQYTVALGIFTCLASAMFAAGTAAETGAV